MAAPDFAASNICAEQLAIPRPKQRARSKPHSARAAALIEMLLNLVTGAGAFALSSLVFHSVAPQVHREAYPTALAFGLILCFLHSRARDKHLSCGLLRIRESERALRISIQSVVFLFIFNLIWNLDIPNGVFVVAITVVPALFVAQQHAMLTALRKWQQSTGCADRTIVYGAGESARVIVSALNCSPRLGIQLAAVAEQNTEAIARPIEIFGYRGRALVSVQSRAITPNFLESLGADLLMLSPRNLSKEELKGAEHAAAEAGVNVGVVYDYAAHADEQMACDEIDGLLFTRPATRDESWLYPALKRITDVGFSLLLLLVLSPLLLLIAMLIRFDSPGPALFVQKRVGSNGAVFNIYKFRSMYASAPKYEVSPTNSRDIRITRIGRILRRTSLDELPQLINVLLGNMSLVGPRPEMPFIVDRYDQDQRRRLRATPGITGLWQLSADRAFPIHHNMHYDLYYIKNRNSFMDIAILIHTLFFAVSGGV